MAKISKIAVLTSGGDAPGMNAAIRAVTRTAIHNKLEVIGIKEGYSGMIEKLFTPLWSHDVSDIIQRGGTILKTARCMEFKTEEGRQIAYNNMKEIGVNGIIVIGGDGTFTGARIFNEEFDIPMIGIPGTIDNDLYGTDYTIGYDTALNTVVEAVDKIRDTASAHNRMFFVEVMGAEAGFIALRSGIASGAEAIIIPEQNNEVEKLNQLLESGRRQKASNIVIVAEGDQEGGAYKLANRVKEHYPNYDIRITVLGHLQRGGSPSAFDRVTASRLGYAAVEALMDDQKSSMVGIQNNEIALVPFRKAIKLHKNVNQSLLEIADVLSS
ncbi:MAG: 6-phosphofructokinase [Bacteroidales bacterium]|jgi:6-phosphofructokinase|nr:6-phosphofructokinase [Bacteroidales bacterium]